MTNEPDEARIGEALRRLRHEVVVPPVDPRREDALLAAFDAHRARSIAGPQRHAGRWVWVATAAASIALAAALDWAVVTQTPRPGGEPSPPAVDTAGFVAWPGASTRPRFESGSLVQVDLPVSSLPALGLWPPPSAGSVVHAEVVVGQDGFARAVRLVQ